jgi:hypothetical protein
VVGGWGGGAGTGWVEGERDETTELERVYKCS